MKLALYKFLGSALNMETPWATTLKKMHVMEKKIVVFEPPHNTHTR
jgi:hypothetical protein